MDLEKLVNHLGHQMAADQLGQWYWNVLHTVLLVTILVMVIID